MIKVLFVCLGNICRSPMAHMVLTNMIRERSLENNFEIDSAGTEGYNELNHAGIHFGTKKILKENSVPFSEHYSRKIRKSDYQYYDFIIAMDMENIVDIEYIVGADRDNKIKRLLDYTNNPRNIKDPWYTGNFEETYADVVEGCEAFLKYLEKNNLM
ncbi:low molecular weight phosphotyrosine protein phosphatase [bacterium]|nr:low molecular weight phosphotyrosine protein phosphatase [bacterium]